MDTLNAIHHRSFCFKSKFTKEGGLWPERMQTENQVLYESLRNASSM